MDASLIPVSNTLISPNSSCIPSIAWFTPPILPVSSPNVNISGCLLKSVLKLFLRISLPSINSSELKVGATFPLFKLELE